MKKLFIFIYFLFSLLSCSSGNKYPYYSSINLELDSFNPTPVKNRFDESGKKPYEQNLLLHNNKNSMIDFKRNIQSKDFSGNYKTDELLNYFEYNLPKNGTDEIEILSEIASCPWDENNYLALVSVIANPKEQEVKIEKSNKNIVFAIDTSGSMSGGELNSAIQFFLEKLRKQNYIISLIEYKDDAIIKFSNKSTLKDISIIHNSIFQLNADGGTNASTGFKLAYKEAEVLSQNGKPTEIIILSDGDFGGLNLEEGSKLKTLYPKFTINTYVFTLQERFQNYKVNEEIENLFPVTYLDKNNKLDKKKYIENTIGLNPILNLLFNEEFIEDYRILSSENSFLNKDKSKYFIPIYNDFSHHLLIEIKPKDKINKIKLADIELSFETSKGKIKKINSELISNSKNGWSASENFRFAAGIGALNLNIKEGKLNDKRKMYIPIHLIQDSINFDPSGNKKIFYREILSL